MNRLLTRILGVPPALLPLELRREFHELRTRSWLARSAVLGAPIAHRLLIDNGTLVIPGQARYAIVARCRIVNSAAGAVSYEAQP